MAVGIKMRNAKISVNMAQKAGRDILSEHDRFFICFIKLGGPWEDTADAASERREDRAEEPARLATMAASLLSSSFEFTFLKNVSV